MQRSAHSLRVGVTVHFAPSNGEMTMVLFTIRVGNQKQGVTYHVESDTQEWALQAARARFLRTNKRRGNARIMSWLDVGKGKRQIKTLVKWG
jgi:hypothetical protein